MFIRNAITNTLRFSLPLTILVLCISCNERHKKEQAAEESKSVSMVNSEDNLVFPDGIEIDSSKYTYSFDFPVGKPDAKGYYNAQFLARIIT